MASELQITSLPGLLAVKMVRQQISLTNGLTSGGNDELKPNTIDLRVDHTY